MTVSRFDRLFENVILVAPTIGWWKGHYQLPRGATEVRLGGNTVGSVTTPQAILMTDEYPMCLVDGEQISWKKRLSKIESRQLKLGEVMTHIFPIRGVRMLPVDCADEYLRKTEENTALLGQAGRDFAAHYEAIQDEIRQNIPAAVWAAVRHKLPPGSQIAGKFHMDVTPVQLAGAGSLTDREALAAHQSLIRTSINRKVEEAIESMVREPREQLAAALTELGDLIGREGRITERSFNGVKEAIAKIRNFGFVANAELLARITELETRVGATTAETLRTSTEAAQGFRAALEVAVQGVRDAQAIESDMARFGRPLRTIRSSTVGSAS